jgi:glycosyltransferase EpsH
MNHPLVSIIIPVYNVEKYLHQCLESVVKQSYTNLEIIIVNDGSSDKSHFIIDDFASRDFRIKIIKQQNRGISAARNSGIQASSGELIMFIDSDDWVEEEIVEKLFSEIEDYDLVVCSYNRSYNTKSKPRVFDIEGRSEGKEFQRRLIGLLKEELKDPSQLDSFVTVWGKLYKAKFIKENQLSFISTREIGTCEDLIFNFQYLESLKEIFIINQPLYNYRKNNDSSFTSNYKANLFFLWKNLFNQLEKLIYRKEDVFNKAFKNRIALSLIGLGLNEMQNPAGFLKQYKNLKDISNHLLYKKAYSELDLSYFPPHWRLFFTFAKYRFVIGVYGMLLGMNYFVNRNK